MLLLLLLISLSSLSSQAIAITSGEKCFLCTLIVNEVEGFITENRTSTEISQYITTHICDKLPKEQEKALCIEFATKFPLIAKGFIQRWNVSTICNDLHFCDHPIHQPIDPQPIPRFKLDLSMPPFKRWQGICARPEFQKPWLKFINELDHLVGPSFSARIEAAGRFANRLLPKEYGHEIEGCAQTLFGNLQDPRWGWLTVLNIAYELSDACTSIVAQTTNGTIIHGRNMDFWAGGPLTNTLRDVAMELDVYNGTELKFKSTTFAGFIGVLSGQKPGVFSVTVNTRFYPKGPLQLLEEAIIALKSNNFTLVALLTREALMKSTNFNEAMGMLSDTPLIADVYYTVAGTLKGEGAVITRNRTGAENVWTLKDSKYEWFVLETNYDHWKKVPWIDDRRGPGVQAMKNIGPSEMNVKNMYRVLSTKPVLNIQTAYTFLSIPSSGVYHSVKRYCQYPCVE